MPVEVCAPLTPEGNGSIESQSRRIPAHREAYWTDFYRAGPYDEVFDVGWPVR